LVASSDASPDEQYVIRFCKGFGSRSSFAAAVFCILFFFAGETIAIQKDPADSQPPSCAAGETQPVKAKPKAAVKAPAKTPSQTKSTVKPAVARKRVRRAAVKPLVSDQTKKKAEAITSEIGEEIPKGLEREISKFFGMRYRYGAEGKGGIDCSALVKEVYENAFGISLPRSSFEQSRFEEMEDVEDEELKTGDLVFFGPSRKRVNHVGMYLSGGYFLHAARSEGVTISRLDKSYWRSRYMFSKRFRGLEVEEEDDKEQELQHALEAYSTQFALGAGKAAQAHSLLEVGVRLNDSLELALTSYLTHSLEDLDEQPESRATSPPSQVPPEKDQPQSTVRLAALFSPAEWFKLVTSVAPADDKAVEQKNAGDFQRLGLETWMLLPSTGLALFLAAHADNQEDLVEQPLKVSPDLQTLDIALGLQYELSDTLRFSLWGTRSSAQYQRPADDAGRRGIPVDDVSFKLDVRF
jgi:lipoprotein Spr